MEGTVKKEEVEQLLGCGLAEGLFNNALEYAQRKQDYIYKQERRGVVLQHWYLVYLTAEYAKSLAFSVMTMNLCRLHNMEKEHLAKNQGAPTDIHIVACPV